MKIAILTLPVYSNYGGILQCYALQYILERMGHEVKVLKKPTFSRTYYIIYPLAICKRLFKRFVLNQKIAILKAPHQIVRQHTNRFIHQYLNLYIKKHGRLRLLLISMQLLSVAIKFGVRHIQSQ